MNKLKRDFPRLNRKQADLIAEVLDDIECHFLVRIISSLLLQNDYELEGLDEKSADMRNVDDDCKNYYTYQACCLLKVLFNGGCTLLLEGKMAEFAKQYKASDCSIKYEIK